MSAPPTGDILADVQKFDEYLAIAARSDLRIFAQYVLRNESPSAVGLMEGEEWSADELVEIEAAFDGLASDAADRIQLQPYHLELLDAYRANQFLSVVAHTESGKTQLAIAYVLWRLGRDRRTRVAVVSEGSRLALIICRTIARYIGEESFEGCKALRRVFPHLRPGARWGDEYYGVDRPAQIKDPSFSAFGEKAGVTGIRADIILCDDLVTPTTTATPYVRGQLVQTFDTKIQNRRTPRGQIINQCNAQWSDDLSAKLEARRIYKAHRMRVTKDGTPTGELEWPGKWTRSHIQTTIQANPDWRAMLFAERRQVGEHGRFNAASIAAALRAGTGLILGAPLQSYAPGSKVCIGIDFAFGGDDRCAIVAILVEPPAPGDVIGPRRLLDVVRGDWNEVKAVAELSRIVSRYPEAITHIRGESNGAQKWIVTSVSKKLGRMIQPYRTSGSKWDANTGIPALAAAFDNGLWILPSDEFGDAQGEVAELIRGMERFDPSRAGLDHTDDRLMALFFADGLARETKHHEYLGGFLGDSVLPPEPEPEPDAPPRPAPVFEPAPAWSMGDFGGGPSVFGGW